MRPLLEISRGIDWLNEKLGTIANWLVLLACMVSGGNAMIRYAYDQSSNAWLEVQWYMFAVIVMFGTARMTAMSSMAWWVIPPGVVMPSQVRPMFFKMPRA